MLVRTVPDLAYGPQVEVLTWADPDDLKDVSRVTFEIEPMKEMVCLTVTHDDFRTPARSPKVGRVCYPAWDRSWRPGMA